MSLIGFPHWVSTARALAIALNCFGGTESVRSFDLRSIGRLINWIAAIYGSSCVRSTTPMIFHSKELFLQYPNWIFKLLNPQFACGLQLAIYARISFEILCLENFELKNALIFNHHTFYWCPHFLLINSDYFVLHPAPFEFAQSVSCCSPRYSSIATNSHRYNDAPSSIGWFELRVGSAFWHTTVVIPRRHPVELQCVASFSQFFFAVVVHADVWVLNMCLLVLCDKPHDLWIHNDDEIKCNDLTKKRCLDHGLLCRRF